MYATYSVSSYQDNKKSTDALVTIVVDTIRNRIKSDAQPSPESLFFFMKKEKCTQMWFSVRVIEIS